MYKKKNYEKVSSYLLLYKSNPLNFSDLNNTVKYKLLV